MRFTGEYIPNLTYRLRSLAEARGVWAFVVLILGIHTAVTVCGGPEMVVGFYKNFGLTREGVFGGKVWQIVSYGLIHGNFLHVALNSIWVVLIGSRIELVLGASGLWKALAAGIFGGGVGHLLLSPGGEGASILVGASGGCMALLILMATLSPESRMRPLPVSARNLALGVMMTALILALVDPALGVPGLSRIGEILQHAGLGSWFAVGHACHFGGGMAGFAMGCWLLRPRVTTESLRRDRERREARKVR